MHDLLDILGSLPVLPFAAGLGLSAIYWVVTLASGMDLGTDGLDGAAEGAVDGALDSAADGAADAATEGAGEGWGDSLLALVGPIMRLGRVPLTVWLSLFTWWGFLISVVGSAVLQALLPAGNLILEAGALGFSALAATFLAGLSGRPLEPIFRTVSGRRRAQLLGETAEVTTGRVDGRFGQARILVGGDELVVQVRCDKPDNGIVRGQAVLVVEFDEGRDAFIVEPMTQGRG